MIGQVTYVSHTEQIRIPQSKIDGQIQCRKSDQSEAKRKSYAAKREPCFQEAVRRCRKGERRSSTTRERAEREIVRSFFHSSLCGPGPSHEYENPDSFQPRLDEFCILETISVKSHCSSFFASLSLFQYFEQEESTDSLFFPTDSAISAKDWLEQRNR